MTSCVFCGASDASFSPAFAKFGICSRCMDSLAKELHEIDKLGVKKLEGELSDIEKCLGR